MTRLWRARRAAAGERGFSLLEVVVGMSVLAAIFVAGGGVLARSLGGVLFSRQNQQAGDVISQEIEQLRAANFAAVAMQSSDLTGDSRITSSLGSQWFDPDGAAGPLAAERIVTATGGVVAPHVEIVTLNSTDYRVARYVTDPEDAAGNYRRVTVVASWQRSGRVHERQASTFVTQTRRGLPLPNFTFTGPVSVQANQGTKIALPVTLTNRGATDSWNLSAQNQSGRPWVTQWYSDSGDASGETGAFDATDHLLIDTDADGRPETGALGTDEALQLFAVVTLSASEVIGVTQHQLTAQSMAQPSSATGTANVTDTVTVLAQPCEGCTYETYYFRNASTSGATTAKWNMPITSSSDAPTQTSLPNYDTDVDSAAGRRLTRGGNADSSGSSNVVNWRYLSPARTFDGNANVTLYVADPDVDLDTYVTLTVYIRHQTTGQTYVTAASSSVTLMPGQTFEAVALSIPVDFTVSNNKRWEVKVVANAGLLHDDAALAYDTTTYLARVEMPRVV